MRQRLCGRRGKSAPLALPSLRHALLCLGGSGGICLVRALRKVRQHGSCRVFRASTGSAISLGCCAGCVLPRTAAPCAEIGFSHFGFTGESCLRKIRWNPEWNHIPPRTSNWIPCRICGEAKIDIHPANRMIIDGDGVRLITAVLLAGQMMTPDKILVAEPCLRQ